MKPSEIFPGAVVRREGICMVAKSPGTEYIVMMDGLIFKHEDLSPLPISPAVLRGLGLENRENIFCNNLISVHQYFDGTYSLIGECDVRFTHQLQALCIHLYGVELVWNQSEYKKAMKEETKP